MIDRKVKFTNVGFSLGHLIAALLSSADPACGCGVRYLGTHCYMYVMTCASKSIYEVMTLQDLKWHADQLILHNELASVVPCAIYHQGVRLSLP